MTTADTDRMVIESAMPTFDTVIAEHVVVATDTSTTFQAARDLDLLTVRTPLLTASMWVRGLPERWSGRAAPARFPGWSWRDGGMPGWLVLGEKRDREIAFGAGWQILAARHRMA